MHESIGWQKWMLDRAYVLVPAQFGVGKFLETFKEFPPRQEVGSFSLDKVLAKMRENRAQ